MTVTWTSEQVLALSPDAGSTKRGKALATTGKWPILGATEQAIWGECKGSGKKPYRTIIDLSEPAFRCSCPSRKFPCKHAIGLFLLRTEGATFGETGLPDWGAEWIEKRSKKQAQQQAPTPTEKDTTVNAADPTAQTKRQAKRAENVSSGLADLTQWMEDIVRQGLVSMADKPYAFWDGMAARMVDAQAPGIANRIRALGNICHSGEGWPERLLKALGELHLLVEGYQQIAHLAPAMREEVMKQIGFPQKQESVLLRAEQGDPLVTTVEDTWLVLGKVVTTDESLKVQRVWLWGVRSQQVALVLSFAHGRRQPLDVSLVPGASLDAALVFYPGTGQKDTGYRALVKTRTAATLFSADNSDWLGVGCPTAESAIAPYIQALSQNPWTVQVPLILNHGLLRYQNNDWYLQDSAGECLPIASQFSQGWALLAMSGGKALYMAGEWNGHDLRPISVWSEHTFMALEG
ncbi:MAG: SWIM zinc finger domain-containing protein [Phormidesmis sp.]